MILSAQMRAELRPDDPWQGLTMIGFWVAPNYPSLPDPRDYVDPTWDRSERDRVVTYLHQGRELHRWRGVSWCRFQCGVEH